MARQSASDSGDSGCHVSDRLFCCTGGFSYLSFYQDCLDSVFADEEAREDKERKKQAFVMSASCDYFLPEFFQVSTLDPEIEDYSSCNLRVSEIPNFYADGRDSHVVASGTDSRPHHVNLIDTKTRAIVARLSGHQGQIWGVCGIPPLSGADDRPLLFSGGAYNDSCLFLWNPRNGKRLLSLPDAPDATLRISHVPEWRVPEIFVSGCQASRVERYSFASPPCKLGSYSKDVNRSVWGFGVSAERKLIYVCGGGDTRVFAVDQFESVDSFEHPSKSVGDSVVVDDARNLVVIGTESGDVVVRDLRNLGVSLCVFRPANRKCHDIAQIDENRFFCGCNSSVAVCSADGKVHARRHSSDFSGDVYGVCVVGGEDEGQSVYDRQAEEERIEFLTSSQLTENSFVHLRSGQSGSVLLLRIPRSFVAHQ